MLYEVVTGLIRLDRRKEFFELHGGVYLPLARGHGVRTKCLLQCDIGAYNSFLDIYEYYSFAEYERITDKLVNDPRLEAYYARIAGCIHGGIQIQLMREMPYK